MQSPTTRHENHLPFLFSCLAFIAIGCAPATQQSQPITARAAAMQTMRTGQPAPDGQSTGQSARQPTGPASTGTAANGGKIDVRMLCLAPSPYTNRHDSLRAGYGILVLLEQVIAQHDLPIAATYYDASEFYEDDDKIARAISGARVVILGASTWAQGTSFYLRRFLEKASSESLLGVSASAWATAGGAHTGGEMVIATTLRSLMGMGAQVFTMGQKSMVFTTDERLTPRNPGYFSRLDIWYMDQFARTIAVNAMASQPGLDATEWAKKLGISTHYYKGDFPPSEQTLARYNDLQVQLNLASKPDSAEYRQLRAALTSL